MILALLKLVRFPLILTAVADSVTGALLAYQIAWWELDWTLLAWVGGASACLYSAGMALNDVADAGRDRELHPERPIPSGKIGRGAAAAVGVVLLLAGVALAGAACLAAGTVAAAAAVGVLLYNFLLKRWRIPGAFGMGLIRALNLFMGAVAVHGLDSLLGIPNPAWIYSAFSILLFGYVFAMTLISTLEEGVGPGRHARGFCILQGLAVLMIPGLWGREFEGCALAGTAAAAVLACIVVLSGWKADSREKIMAHVRRSILLIIAVDAVMLLCMGLLVEGACVLALILPSIGMVALYRRV